MEAIHSRESHAQISRVNDIDPEFFAEKLSMRSIFTRNLKLTMVCRTIPPSPQKTP